MIWSRISWISFDTLPRSWLTEDCSAYSFFALITSMTASAWERSILPFKNARFVNSPGSASLAPAFKTVSRIRLVTSMPP